MKPIQIIIAGNYASVHKKLYSILEETLDMEIGAEAKNTEELLRKLSGISYDLVLLETAIPDRNVQDAVKEIKLKWSSISVVVFTVASHEIYAVRAFENGASAYVNRRLNSKKLIQILRKVATGEKFYFSYQKELLKELAT